MIYTHRCHLALPAVERSLTFQFNLVSLGNRSLKMVRLRVENRSEAYSSRRACSAASVCFLPVRGFFDEERAGVEWVPGNLRERGVRRDEMPAGSSSESRLHCASLLGVPERRESSDVAVPLEGLGARRIGLRALLGSFLEKLQ